MAEGEGGASKASASWRPNEESPGRAEARDVDRVLVNCTTRCRTQQTDEQKPERGGGNANAQAEGSGVTFVAIRRGDGGRAGSVRADGGAVAARRRRVVPPLVAAPDNVPVGSWRGGGSRV